jgi:hypothetical protein
MKAALALLVLMLPALAATTVAGYDYCARPTVSMGRLEIGDRTPENTWYVDDRGVAKNSVWIYEESNGVFVGGVPELDLQRGDAVDLPIDDADQCVDDPNVAPDTLIF